MTQSVGVTIFGFIYAVSTVTWFLAFGLITLVVTSIFKLIKI